MKAKHRRTARGASTVVMTISAVALGGGSALAYWTTNGSGSATAAALTASPLTATATTASSDLLYPGRTVPATVSLTNTNPFRVKVTGLSQTARTVADPPFASGGIGACDESTSKVSFAPQTVSWVLPAATKDSSGATVPGTLTGRALPSAITMAADSATGCQNATFTIKLAITAISTTEPVTAP